MVAFALAFVSLRAEATGFGDRPGIAVPDRDAQVVRQLEIRNPGYHQHVQRYLLRVGDLRYVRFGEWREEEVPCRRVSQDGRTTRIVKKRTVALEGGGHTREGVERFLAVRTEDGMPIDQAVRLFLPEMRRRLFLCIAGGELKMSVEPTYHVAELPGGRLTSYPREALTKGALTEARADAWLADKADDLAGVARGPRFVIKTQYLEGLGSEAHEDELIDLMGQTLTRGKRRQRGDGAEEFRSEVSWNGHTFPHLVVTKPLAGGGRAIVDAYPDLDRSGAATLALEEPVHGLISRITNLWALWQDPKVGFPRLQLKEDLRQRLEATYLRDFRALSARITPDDVKWSRTLRMTDNLERKQALTKAVVWAAGADTLSLPEIKRQVAAALGSIKNRTNLSAGQLADVFSALSDRGTVDILSLDSATQKRLAGYMKSGVPNKKLRDTLEALGIVSDTHLLNYITASRHVDDSWGKPL